MTETHQVDKAARYPLWLDAVRTFAIVGVSAVVAWALLTRDFSLAAGGRPLVPGAQQQQPRPEPPLPRAPLSLDGAWLDGSDTARVVLIEFSDFECPFCSRFTQSTLADIKSRYVESGQVQIAFRHFPLVQIHSRAMKAAQAAECAGAQGRFWPMHDAIFADQSRIAAADLLEKARGLDLDDKAFSRCLDGSDAKITSDISAARTLEVSGTPTLFVGLRRADGRVDVKRRITGAVPFAQLAPALDSALAEG